MTEQRLKKFYSSHLGEIEDDRFQAALNKFELGDLLSAEAIPHGLFGQNVSLKTTKGQFIFRGRGQFRNERYMAERLHAETKAPVAWPYRLDDSNEIFEWQYLIMPKLPGLPLESRDVQATLTPEDRLEIAEAMGGLLRELQKLKNPYCGLYDEDAATLPAISTTYTPPWKKRPASATGDAGSSMVNFQQWIPSRIRWHLNVAVEHNDESKGRVTTPADLQWFESLVENSHAALSQPFQPGFVMDDFKEGNTVVTKIDGQWKITGVFDFGSSYFGDGEADLARIFVMYGMGNPEPSPSAAVFLKSYFHPESPRPGFLERARLYFLMDIVVFWYFFRRRGNYDAFPDFQSWCQPQLDVFHQNLTRILKEITNKRGFPGRRPRRILAGGENHRYAPPEKI